MVVEGLVTVNISLGFKTRQKCSSKFCFNMFEASNKGFPQYYEAAMDRTSQ